jgi:hypothetical protein
VRLCNRAPYRVICETFATHWSTTLRTLKADIAERGGCKPCALIFVHFLPPVFTALFLNALGATNPRKSVIVSMCEDALCMMRMIEGQDKEREAHHFASASVADVLQRASTVLHYAER